MKTELSAADMALVEKLRKIRAVQIKTIAKLQREYKKQHGHRFVFSDERKGVSSK